MQDIIIEYRCDVCGKKLSAYLDTNHLDFVFNGRDGRRRTIKLENICDKCARIVDRAMSDLITGKGRK